MFFSGFRVFYSGVVEDRLALTFGAIAFYIVVGYLNEGGVLHNKQSSWTWKTHIQERTSRYAHRQLAWHKVLGAP